QMDPDDDEFAKAVIPLLQAMPTDTGGPSWTFDALNEAFGHLVQHSFRNRKEDAQYMTPPEVVSGMVDMAFCDNSRFGWTNRDREPFVVADPTCGVGSFLAAAYRRACHLRFGNECLAERMQLFGQDKVDRMVRLANANLRVFARTNARICQGNSILPPSGLDDV